MHNNCLSFEFPSFAMYTQDISLLCVCLHCVKWSINCSKKMLITWPNFKLIILESSSINWLFFIWDCLHSSWWSLVHSLLGFHQYSFDCLANLSFNFLYVYMSSPGFLFSHLTNFFLLNGWKVPWAVIFSKSATFNSNPAAPSSMPLQVYFCQKL